MEPMLWFDRGGLDQAAYASLCAQVGQRRPRVLAVADTAEGKVIALPDRLVIRRGDEWSDITWEQIVRGGWDAASMSFTWTLTDGSSGGAAVTEARNLPEVFRERVNSSIAVNHRMEDKACRGVMIVARRNPAARASRLTWQVIGAPGVDVTDPAIEPLIDAQLERLRAEYDIS